MVVIGQLRLYRKNTCFRLLTLMFVMSLVVLVIIPQITTYTYKDVIKIMSVTHQEHRLENDTTSKHISDVNRFHDNNNRSLIPALPPNEAPVPTVITTVKNPLNFSGNAPNNSLLSTKSNNNQSTTERKFLIYICQKSYCYGIGDRQRAIVGVYLLAELTNRRFGIIMTSPSNFTEFYQPNLVPWNIPQSELEGRSSVEILAYGPRVQLGLHEIDFNKVYPQDVVYVRSNQKWEIDLLKNHHYRGKFPAWANVPTWKIFQVGWLRLMTPTKVLRKELNNIIIQIVQDMENEYSVYNYLNNTKCCENKYINVSSCKSKPCDVKELQILCCNLSENNASTHVVKTCDANICANESNVMNCESVICPVASITKCYNKTCGNFTANENSRSFKTNDCVRYVESTTTNITELSRFKPFARDYCEENRPVLAPWMSIQGIEKSQGFDTLNINLVCVHIRIGHSATLPRDSNVRNKPQTVSAVWNFLKPYVATGQHVYLATDSQEVRQQAKDIFGRRLHISSVPIQHIALVTKGQNERSAFSLTLVEQLLLATSCKVLVISYSGFSMKAAMIRDALPGDSSELYMFHNGRVEGKSVRWLLR